MLNIYIHQALEGFFFAQQIKILYNNNDTTRGT